MASTRPGGAMQTHSGGACTKTVKVRLTIEEVDRQAGKVTRYSSKQESGDHCDDGKGNLDFKDKNKWNGPVEIAFKIKNESGCTMALAADPLWVLSGGGCPEQQAYEPEEFQVVSGTGAMELTVLDLNKIAGAYGYALRFDSADSQTGHFLLDPVITNGGGGGNIE